ncbi:MAG: HAMP domain-containing sensor histidine kinase [Lachnospiraceae bacterium]|nr:HAMP domain-containing sensor histidine kinase [Lachnospiraceae bacterium]
MFKDMKIGKKLTLVMVLIIAGVICLTLIFNTLFAIRFHGLMERKHLRVRYEKVEKALSYDDADKQQEAIRRELTEQQSSTNIQTVIIPVSLQSKLGVCTNVIPGTDFVKESIRQLVIIRDDLLAGSVENGNDTSEGSTSEKDGNAFGKKFGRFPWSDNNDNTTEILRTKGSYLTTYQSDSGDVRYLCLIGYANHSYLVMMTSSISNIQASARVANKLIIIIGLGAILLACILISYFASRFTRPIKDMAAVAEKMANQDFDVKVRVESHDEIGELGHAMNEMSEKLEMAISELKKANLELEADIKDKIEIDDMRKEFISHVSHELKTPIALIQGYAEGLTDGVADDPESIAFYCDVIMDEANKMNTMVRKLLNLTQIEFGKNQVEIERFDIYQLIQNKIDASQIMFAKKNNTVIFQEKGPRNVWADEFMIEEVFSNYFSNALNHVYQDGKIRIYFENLGDDLRVHVYNDGDHIPEEDLDKLWIKFYKVDKARTREYGGSGIGLSIVAATMKAHGKAYGVNNVDGGVDFYFDLDCKG